MAYISAKMVVLDVLVRRVALSRPTARGASIACVYWAFWTDVGSALQKSESFGFRVYCTSP